MGDQSQVTRVTAIYVTFLRVSSRIFFINNSATPGHLLLRLFHKARPQQYKQTSAQLQGQSFPKAV